jgi:hypothetical protein
VVGRRLATGETASSLYGAAKCSLQAALLSGPDGEGEVAEGEELPEFGRVEMSNGSEKIETARSPQTPTSVDLHIDPKPVKYTQKGPWYTARLHMPDGEILVCSTEPLLLPAGNS